MSAANVDTNIPLDSERTLETVERLAAAIREKTRYNPRILIVCGSGLGKIASLVRDADVIPYSDIAGFPRSTVPGHSGNLHLGKLALQGETVEAAVMQGRCHSYEGYSHWHASLRVRALQLLGVRVLVLTSAVGSLRADLRPGDVVVLRDHLNLPAWGGRNPLFGIRDPRLGPRILPVKNMYDRMLRKLALQAAQELHLQDKLHVGALGISTGPQFEGVAEALWFRQLGLEVMGMSVAHEALQARHCGVKVLTFTVVSNAIATEYDFNAFSNLDTHKKAKQDTEQDAEHFSVLEICERACDYLVPILQRTLEKALQKPEIFELTTYGDGDWKD